tara:strand:+ start:44 stop:760 length:717 start_codon:yes stop_codon:yes gene_type:complete
MITKNQIKLIRSLRSKKNRYKYQLFVVEGRKNIRELLDSDYHFQSIFATNSWIKDHQEISVIKVTNNELLRISNQKNPNEVLAIVKIKSNHVSSKKGVVLVLDDVNDPGNMGTIIRVCDWFGISNIICSNDSVDLYNPKVIQSSMGSIFRVNVIYTDLLKYLQGVDSPIYGAYMNGEDVKNISFSKNLHLVMGNESKGISENLSHLISNKVRINNIGESAESLNVAVASSILLYEICN